MVISLQFATLFSNWWKNCFYQPLNSYGVNADSNNIQMIRQYLILPILRLVLNFKSLKWINIQVLIKFRQNLYKKQNNTLRTEICRFIKFI